MGLDMEIRRISKPNYNKNEIYDRYTIDGLVLSETDIEEEMFKQLAPYCQKLNVRNQYYDMDKIRADYGLSDRAYIGMYSATQIVVCDSVVIDGRVEISTELIKEKYTLEKIEDCFVCKSEEVKYWRKAYDVQEWFYERIDNIENTGYYLLSAELQREFNEAWPDDILYKIEEPDETSALFYWEWY